MGRLQRLLTREGLGPTLARAISGSLGLRIAGLGFGFLVGVQLARGLGAEGYGVYGVAMSIITLLAIPTEFGLPSLLTREVAAAQLHGQWGKIRGILHWSARVSLLVSAAIGIGVLVWLLFREHGPSTRLGMTLLVGVVMVPVVALLTQRSAALRGLQKIVRGQVPDVVLRPALHSLLLFVVPMLGLTLGPELAMGLGVVSAAAVLVVAQAMLSRALPEQVRLASPQVDTRNWWRAAVPMALSQGMFWLQGNLMVLMLGGMVAMAEVGVFRVASSVAIMVAMPVSLFNVVGMPLIARLHAAGDKVRLQRLLSLSSLGMLLGTAALALPFLIAGEPLLVLVFGSEFAASLPILLVLCVAILANAVFGLSANLLNMAGHPGDVTRASLLSVIVLATAAAVLIPWHGGMGAAYAQILASLAWNLPMWRKAKQRLGLDAGLWSLLVRPGRQGGNP